MFGQGELGELRVLHMYVFIYIPVPYSDLILLRPPALIYSYSLQLSSIMIYDMRLKERK